jgi:hypothetical protein
VTGVVKPGKPAPDARREPTEAKARPEPAAGAAPDDGDAKCTICGLRSCWRG